MCPDCGAHGILSPLPSLSPSQQTLRRLNEFDYCCLGVPLPNSFSNVIILIFSFFGALDMVVCKYYIRDSVNSGVSGENLKATHGRETAHLTMRGTYHALNHGGKSSANFSWPVVRQTAMESNRALSWEKKPRRAMKSSDQMKWNVSVEIETDRGNIFLWSSFFAESVPKQA